MVEAKRCAGAAALCTGKAAFDVVGQSRVVAIWVVDAAKHIDDAALIEHA